MSAPGDGAEPGLRPIPVPADARAQLSALALLDGADDAEVDALVSCVEWLHCDAGVLLFDRGDHGDAMYTVVRGRLECVADGEVLREAGRGETVGELALLTDRRRVAAVRALRDTVLVRLPADRFDELVRRSPRFSLLLARIVADRAMLGAGGRRGRAAPGSVAVVALEDPLVADHLAAELSPVLDAASAVGWLSISEILSWADADGLDVALARLAEAEDRCDTLVVTMTGRAAAAAASGALAQVAGAVLRQMDLVVAVARPRRPIDPSVMALLGDVNRPVTAVLVHPGAARPSGTSRWLEGLRRKVDVRDHVHVRRGHPPDVARLARALLGRTVGVVLGGGGSRGFAHIGVIRALRERGIAIDRVGGSSMGSIIAAQVASGWTADEMLQHNRSAWSRAALFEFGLPTLSILRGRRAGRVIDGLFADVRMEDLWLDYFCTTVDLSACHLNIARSGSVARWVQASCTVPGLWPPMVDGKGHLHVDGGLMDNVPTDVMRSGEAGWVIGVDVCKRQSEMRLAPWVDPPAGARLVLKRWRGEWFPTIYDVLNRSNLLTALVRHQDAEQHADLYLSPPTEDEGFAAFGRIAELAEMGHRYAVAELERLDDAGDLDGLMGTSALG